MKVNPPKQGLKLHSKQGSVGFRGFIDFTTLCVSSCHVRPLGPCSTISLKSAICFHVHRNPWLPQRGMLAIVSLPILTSLTFSRKHIKAHALYAMVSSFTALDMAASKTHNVKNGENHMAPEHLESKTKKHSKSVCSRNSALFVFDKKKSGYPWFHTSIKDSIIICQESDFNSPGDHSEASFNFEGSTAGAARRRVLHMMAFLGIWAVPVPGTR